jgi:SecD/SecF fusion protein
MQSKGVIKLLAILLAIACIYQLSFSLKARSVEKKAAEYAAKVSESDSLRQAAEIYYLDSVQNRPVYDLGFISFTYKEVKEKEINLGLDLKGGMNVMLEVQVEDVLKALAGDSAHDPMFEEAIARANKALKEGTNNYIGEFAKAYREVSGGAPLAALFVSPDRKDITPNSSDSEVEKILQEETDAAIDASFNILRSRIDHFGVTQPNIQRLPNSHRILVELPGVKEPERVRKLLQGTASLEFWTTYNNTELVRALEQADQLLRDELAAGATDAAVEETLTEEQPTAAGTEDTTESLIAEVQNNAPAAEEAASASGASRYTREENPLFSLLNPYDGGGAVVGSVAVADTATVAGYLRMDAVRELLPSDVRFEWGIKGEPQNNGRFSLYALKVSTPDGKAPLDGSVIVDARETYAERGAEAKVSMSMNSEGIQDWARLTGDNIGRCIAIVLDGYVYSAPVLFRIPS